MMENAPEPRASLTVKVMDHGTIVGTDEPVCLDFEDCVNAVDGLVHWMASVLAEANEADMEKIGSDILIAALGQWTFDEHIDNVEEMDSDDDGDDTPPGPHPGFVN